MILSNEHFNLNFEISRIKPSLSVHLAEHKDGFYHDVIWRLTQSKGYHKPQCGHVQ